jgi:type II secretory pathway pseudopilin PulG
MTQKIKTHPEKSCYSLVELLVTVSVLMVLISLLSPSLNKMLRSAHETTCSHGIRDLLLVTHVQAENNNGAFMDLRTNHNGGVSASSSPYWAKGNWRTTLTQEYHLNRDTFYSPSNDKWNSDSFYYYAEGSFMVMGRMYFGSPSNKNHYHNRTPAANRGTPTFASHVNDVPSQKVLWTDLNRKWQGFFVNPDDPNRRHGSNHLYEPDLLWPALSHNGNYDGSVSSSDSENIQRKMNLNGAEIFW